MLRTGLLLALALPAFALRADPVPESGAVLVPSVEAITAAVDGGRTMRAVVARFAADMDSLDHFHDVPWGPQGKRLREQAWATWRERLAAMDFESMGVEDRIDWLLLDREIASRQRDAAIAHQRFADVRSLLPEVEALLALAEDRRLMRAQSGAEAAAVLERARVAIEAREKEIASGGAEAAPGITRAQALRASRYLGQAHAAIKDWHGFYDGYDPQMSWWVAKPFEQLDAAMQKLATTLRDKLAGASDPEVIVGDPVGRASLQAALEDAAIPYTPAELLKLARRELAWCHAELAKAATEMGYDDWHDALEAVKQRHPAPGEQPALVRELAWEAIDWLEHKELISIPELAKRDWRMNMLSTEAQLQAPFFLGGEDVWVAYPTADMPHEKKAMALRGNNRHFSRAVVHHELIPGHHLQHFMTTRYHPERRLFGTPFWSEGWALYWEFRLYELGFAPDPADRIGMLVWRAHRAARIIFSFGFHLGEMSPEEAIDFLVSDVGHERENAAAEVRRSFAGDWPPIYQAAYMLGGLQFLALQRELVASGQMTERQFHDAVMQGGTMPVEFVRMRLRNEPPSRDFESSWRFYDLGD